MVEQSVFRGTLEFFNRLGIYDVILPFLLVFSIVFAILEKTKIFGMEKIGDEKYTRKNINAMVAFVIGFMTIASAQLVQIITTVSSQVVLLLLLSVLFLLLVGSFYKETDEGFFLTKGWNTAFMIIMFVGIVAIFLQAIKIDTGEGFLAWLLGYIGNNLSSTAVGSIILLIIVIVLMMFIVKDRKPKKEEKKEK